MFKNVLFSVLFFALISVCTAVTARAADSVPASFSKTDIEKIIHDYIMDNPQTILESVDNYQRKSRQAHQSDALSKNKDSVFKDGTSPEAGSADPDVTIAEFFDYNCHYCKNALPDVKALLEKDKKVRVVFKDFPILGPSSEVAAKWALAAQKQNKYFEFHVALMNNKEPINDELLEKLAKQVSLDVEQAKKDITSTGVLLQIEKNRVLASGLGISGTPAFIIGDEIIPGAIPLSTMEEKIAAQRAAAAKK